MSDHFGKWLSHQRGRRGEPGFISQRELAGRMGVDPTYISQLEKKAGPPSFETRRRIHEVFGTSDDDLRRAGVIVDTRIPAPTATARIEAHAPTIQTSEDPVAERLARLRSRYSEKQIIQLMDIVAGIIELREISSPPVPERPTRRASGE